MIPAIVLFASGETTLRLWRRASWLFALFAALLGLVGLSGWLFDYTLLRSGFSSDATMKFNTAFSLILGGIGLLALHNHLKGISLVALLALLLISWLTIGQHMLDVDLGIDQWLFVDQDTNPSKEAPGRTSLFTTIGLLFTASALLLLSFKHFYLGQLFAIIPFGVAYVSLLGHLFGVSSYYQLEHYSAVAPHTGVGLLLLSLGILGYQPHQGWMRTFSSPFIGGILIRYIFSYFLLLTPLLIALYLQGITHAIISPTTGIIAIMLVACLISLPLAYLLLQRIDQLDAQLRQANHELSTANQDLFSRNKELAALTQQLTYSQGELVAKNRELERANQDLDSFFYMASHDLKSPVNNLEALFRFFETKVAVSLGGAETQLIAMMGSSIGKLKTTIGDLIQLVQAQKADQQERERLSLEQVLQQVQNDLEQQTQETGALIQLHLSVIFLTYSPVQLRSIFYNLLSNALKYRSPERAPFIEISTKSVSGGVKLIFKDNGLGISASRVPQLFALFKRFHTHVEGSGIGLYLVKRIIENNGGSIQVESREGEGTCFTIFFPQSLLASAKNV